MPIELFVWLFVLYCTLKLWLQASKVEEFTTLSQKVVPRHFFFFLPMPIICRLNVTRHKNMATVHTNWCQLPEYSASVIEGMHPPHSSLLFQCLLSLTTCCSLYFNSFSHNRFPSNSYLGHLLLYFQISTPA